MVGTAAEIAELVSRVALGDRAAFSVLYERTSGKLFAICLRILKDRAEAEDALQEVYVRIWRRAGGYRDGRYSAMSWLIAIARNHSIDRLRARQPLSDDIDAAGAIPDSAPNPEAAAVASSEMGRIESCLGELPPERAEAVMAAYVEGYSYGELAQRFAIPLNTMRTWLHRSLKSLRDCLKQSGLRS